MRRYKVGILGSGVISRTYLADIQAFYHALDVTACADLYVELASALAQEFGVPHAYTVEQLLADDEIDIIVNLTPPQMHVAVDRQILGAGKHLFSEKPFAPTLAEAKELLQLAAEKGVQVGCAPDTFLGSGLQSVRYYLDNGLIGKPFFVTANMTSAGVESWHPNPGAFYRAGAGPVMDMAPYYLSAIVCLLGPIESIAAFSAQPRARRGWCPAWTCWSTTRSPPRQTAAKNLWTPTWTIWPAPLMSTPSARCGSSRPGCRCCAAARRPWW